MLKWNRDGDGHRGRSDAWLETRTDGYPADRTRATPTDIIAALKANPEACAEVLAGMGTTHFAARDAEWWHDRFLAEKARAERAEHSLAASERALAALRYQAEAGGCELSTVGENSYNCRADALCGLCRLRHRADQAERSLATVTAERDKARAAHATASRRCDEAQAIADRALGITPGERDSLRSRLAKYEAVVEAALRKLEATRWKPTQPMRDWQVSQDGENHAAVCYAMSALRALDNDSGGSGAATRAEVEELRVRVERLENLVDKL